jgi:hypothetical protein
MIGAMAVLRKNGLTKKGKDSLLIRKTSSSPIPCGGLSLIWYNSFLTFFSEFSMTSGGEYALLSGARISLNDFVKTTMIFRRYSQYYIGLLPSAYAAGTKLRNESGPAILIEVHPFRNATFIMRSDYCSRPWSSYRITGPSSSLSLETEYRHSFKQADLRFTLSFKQWMESDNMESAGIPTISTRTRGKASIRFSTDLWDRLQWTTRIDGAGSGSEKSAPAGFLIYHEVSGVSGTRIRMTLRYCIFHIGDWENRIYCYEPGLRYQHRFTVFNGKGTRLTGSFRYSLSENFLAGCKIGLITYNERETSGFGSMPAGRSWNVDYGFQIVFKH